MNRDFHQPASTDQAQTMCSPQDEEFCPVGHYADPVSNMHCTCWYDGLQCHRCYAAAMPEEGDFGSEEIE